MTIKTRTRQSGFVWRAAALALAFAAATSGDGRPLQAAQVPAGPAAPPGAALRRFALIASANDGGPGRPRLRFADSDARAVADVLASLGGLRAEDTVVLPAVTRATLQSGFGRIKDVLAGAAGGRARRELFVYYSGHSNEEGLLLGGERVAYDELRSWIKDADAEVRIAILDSCASGALIRQKGGSRRASFLQDASTAARGHAFLTASAADEAAQESDRVGGAFFTHFLVSGLRGAADTSRDGRVTLGEAYQFAYHETLLRTERTVGGPQHPEYDIQMAGTGDLLVMTDLRATGAGLLIDESVAGRLYVRDVNGRLLVELRKEPLYPVELGLGPGRYRVSLDADGRPFEASVTLENGKVARLGRGQFVAAASLVAQSRGEAPVTLADVAPAARAPRSYRHVPFELMVAESVRSSGGSEPVMNNFVLGVVGHSHALRGLQLSLGANLVEDDMEGMQVTNGFNQVEGPTRGLQVSVGANLAQDLLEGMQVAAGFNRAVGPVQGLQVSGGVNVAGARMEGLQVAGLASAIRGDLRGLQVSGIANSIRGDLRGLQVGAGNHVGGQVRGGQVGVVSHARRDVEGLQVGAGSWAGGNVRGLQVGVLSYAGGSLRGAQVGVASLTGGSLTGLQVAVVNVGGVVTGSQIGVLNIARKVHGAQIGVINVAGSSDAPIGVFNFIRDGYHRLQLWSSDLSPTNIGFKLGGRYVYTQLGFGVDRSVDDLVLMNGQAGVGMHFQTPEPRLFLDVDAMTSSLGTKDRWNEDGFLNTLRLVVGWQLMRHLAITAGPTFNVHVHKDGERELPGLGFLERVITSGSTRVRLFPGFAVGMQI